MADWYEKLMTALRARALGCERGLHTPDPWFYTDPEVPLCRACTRGKKVVEWPCARRKSLDQQLVDLQRLRNRLTM